MQLPGKNKMKKLLILSLLSLLLLNTHAQNISRITLGPGGNFEKISFGLDENVIVNLSKDGNISSWGIDHYLGQVENYNDKLDPYEGRTEYYGPNDNEAFRGKIKSIGRFYITYYASYDYELIRGKVKSIGTINLDYYMAYDDEAFRGNLKNVGQSQVTWYGTTENAGYKGKLRSFGNTSLSYYASYDDKAYQGKVKTLGPASFTYYSSLDRIGYSGALKTGSMIVYANGVKFFSRN
jgi:hypothetical protein